MTRVKVNIWREKCAFYDASFVLGLFVAWSTRSVVCAYRYYLFLYFATSSDARRLRGAADAGAGWAARVTLARRASLL